MRRRHSIIPLWLSALGFISNFVMAAPPEKNLFTTNSVLGSYDYAVFSMGQSFTPKFDLLKTVALAITCCEEQIPAVVQVELYDELDNLVAVSDQVIVPYPTSVDHIKPNEFTKFTFGGGVAIAAGAPSLIKLVHITGGSGGIRLEGNNSYEGGTAFINDVSTPGSDLFFVIRGK